MLEKAQLTASEIGGNDVVNTSTITQTVTSMDSLLVTRLTVTDHTGKILYDTADASNVGRYALFPEVVAALRCNNVFTWNYRGSTIESRVAVPIMSYGTQIGCVYMLEYDTAQGALIASLEKNIFAITLVLEIIVIIFSIAFSQVFSRRLRRILSSIRIIRGGDYSHKVFMGGHDELTYLGNEFNDLTDRLRDSQRTQRQFVSDASHELKTPLASIKLLADSILQNDMDQETAREFVADIGDEADRLTRMSQKLLSLSRVDSEYGGNREIVYMAPTIRRVARMLRGVVRKNNINLQLDLNNDSPILVLEDDLYQIVFNLVENGIKYNTSGGKLTVTLRREEDNAVIEVSDTGVGIPEDALEHIFERFYRVDKARSRQTGGSGLGLAIVRDTVIRNDGQINVRSVPGQGTVFTVVFPIFETEEE
jgi:signal transduction histidine kinase